jgi:hypothetical protein
MSECELDLMEKQRSDETAKELEYFVKLDNSDEEKRILDWHELESAYESEIIEKM